MLSVFGKIRQERCTSGKQYQLAENHEEKSDDERLKLMFFKVV